MTDVLTRFRELFIADDGLLHDKYIASELEQFILTEIEAAYQRGKEDGVNLYRKINKIKVAVV